MKLATIEPTLKASCTYLSVDSAVPPNPVISIEAYRILLPDISTASKVLKAMRLSEAHVSTNALLI